MRKPRNRHLVDDHRRQGRPKSGTDWRDLAVLLLAFPDLKRRDGPVAQSLEAAGDTAALVLWREIVEQEILPEEDEEEFF